MTLDPVISSLLSISFGLMFLMAAVHKLSDFSRFRSILADYRVLPARVVPAVAVLLPLNEIVLGLYWLFSSINMWLPTVGLLTMYTAGIAINILNGRVHISCGCGFGRSSATDDVLSWGLVIRNLVLIGAALATTLPVSTRPVGALDYATLVAATLALVVLFAAANRLISNAAAISLWRTPVNRDD